MVPLAGGFCECLVYQVKLYLGKGLTCSKLPQSNKKQVLKPLSCSVGVLQSPGGCWEVALPCPGSRPRPPSSCSSQPPALRPAGKASLLGRHFP